MEKNDTVRVWDLPVRLFHWSLVLSFAIAYITHEEGEDLHVLAGYVVLALVIFRIFWGFVGTKYSRFSDFVYGPGKVAEYLKGLFTGRPIHYLGHNPAGALMVFVLLAFLLFTTISGLKLYAVEEGKGPLAGPFLSSVAYAHEEEGHEEEGEGDEAEELWEEVHGFGGHLTLYLVIVHVAGVVVSMALHRENLVKAMITGRKPSGHS